jgi:hypothetical protein
MVGIFHHQQLAHLDGFRDASPRRMFANVTRQIKVLHPIDIMVARVRAYSSNARVKTRRYK